MSSHLYGNEAELEQHLTHVLNSYRRLLGKSLLELKAGQSRRDALEEASFVLLSHGTEADPIFNYANKAGLDLFAISAQAFCQMPSRYSAEPISREARTHLLQQVSTQGYIDHYSGVRIASTGQRFLIEQAVVWNVSDEDGRYLGQAASFATWQWLQPALFAYGTLMCADIMQAVSGQQAQSQSARLHGFARYGVRGQEYPAVVAHAGSVVDGVLYDGLSAAAWQQLDEFEGDEYLRQAVQVSTEDGLMRWADVYVFKDAYRDRLSAQAWSLDAFVQGGGRERFEARYPGYGRLLELE